MVWGVLFQEDDGSTYLVRSVENQYLGISQLSPNFTDTMGLVSTAPQVRTLNGLLVGLTGMRISLYFCTALASWPATS